jgi:hypothetical protein
MREEREPRRGLDIVLTHDCRSPAPPLVRGGCRRVPGIRKMPNAIIIRLDWPMMGYDVEPASSMFVSGAFQMRDGSFSVIF